MIFANIETVNIRVLQLNKIGISDKRKTLI